ncbi:hypothetical protein WA1_45240 [Scytonema hofmannii PCC 7110]|uniref:O-antigen polymerase n=1 Tax=Scytonema hofmannii PCC 7110 TaxID=128403 RepID=A0A139WWQ3_9CYAN|nr:hypothetical protein [Scytonema hofmannii]KYC36868.1 hypothetical protein WA1_45240 [Scytonema hofmannii PCC 7110]
MITEDHLWLMLWLFIWLMVVHLVVRNQWNQKRASAGLPLIYLLSLSMIHWFGALIYAFPWYIPTSAYLMSQDVSIAHVLAGFHQSVYGVIGFGIGSTLLAPWVLKELKPAWLSEVSRPPDLKLPKTYISIGLFICVAIAPILLGVPGLSAITTSGVSLFIVGLCLACWKSWYVGDSKAFLTWLILACSMPLITVLTLGFIGYGAVASLVVLIFVFNFYRPRWKVVITGLLLLVLGLSVFVNYMRDRVEIRATVWGGQSGQTRIERLWQTVTTFELFDPFKQEHLEAIDARLNQNTLVGQTVNHISAGFVDYAHGGTLEQAAIAAIPRLLWPDKPVRAGSPEIVSRYTGIEFADRTSVGVGQVMEFYINFGSIGVFLGFLVYGTLLRIIDISAGQKLINGNWSGFASWFLPGLGLIQPGGSLVEVVASTSASVVLVYFLNKFYQSKTKPGQVLSH